MKINATTVSSSAHQHRPPAKIARGVAGIRFKSAGRAGGAVVSEVGRDLFSDCIILRCSHASSALTRAVNLVISLLYLA